MVQPAPPIVSDLRFEDHLVSIVIPAFNAERFIGAALDSASNQTYRRIEIIVVDDGSTDGTAEVVRQRAASDARIRLIFQNNSGVAAARNRGLAEARGDYFAPLDADDLWRPRKIELQLAAFHRASPDVGLVYTWSCVIDEEGRNLGPMARRRCEGRVLADLVAHNFIGNASVPLVRMAAARATGGYDETLRRMNAQGCEDLRFQFAIAERWAIALVPEALVGYRRTTDSMSMNMRNMAHSRAIVMREVRRGHPEIPAAAFRESDNRFALWAAMKCIHAERKVEGYRLIASAMCRDPALPVRRYARSYVGRTLRYLGSCIVPGRPPQLESKDFFLSSDETASGAI